MRTHPLVATAILNLVLAVFLYSCTTEDNSPGGGGVDLALQGETYLDEVTAEQTIDGTAIAVSWITKPIFNNDWRVTGYRITLTDNSDNPITVDVPAGTGTEYSRDISVSVGSYRVAVVVQVLDTTTDTAITTTPVSAGTVEVVDEAEAPAPPPAPTLVSGNDTVGRGQITVTWDAPSNTGKHVDGSAASITNYTLYWKRGEMPSSTDYDGMVTVADIQDRSYIITNLDSGNYHVAIASMNSAGLVSVLSEVAESPEVVDTTTLGETYLDGVTAASTDEGKAIQVSWTAKTPPAGRTVIGYTITLTNSGDPEITEPVLAGANSEYSSKVTAPSGRYEVAVTVRVRSTTGKVITTSPVSAGVAEVTNAAEAPTPPPAPTVVVSNDTVGRGQITVTWSSPTNTGKDIEGLAASITSYTLYWKRGEPPSSTDYDGMAIIADVGNRSYIITNLDSGIYHVAVASRNSAGLGSILSVVTESPEVVDTTTLGETYLDNLTAISTNEGRAIQVSWTAKTPPAGRRVTGYTITLTDNSDAKITESVPASTETVYSKDIKASIGSYGVAVTVRVTVGDREFITSPVDGGIAAITNGSEFPVPPLAPTLKVGNDDNARGQLTVTWSSPTNTGKNIDGSVASITSYTLYWKRGEAPSSTDYDGTAMVSNTQGRSYIITNLDSGIYHVAIASMNSAGLVSVLSEVAESPEVVDATTLGGTYLDNLTAKSTPDGTAITVSWTAKTPPAGRTVTGYTIILTNSGDPEITVSVLAGTNSEYSRDIKASIGSYQVAVTVGVRDTAGVESTTSPVDGGEAEITSIAEAPTPPPAPTVIASNHVDGQAQLIVTWGESTDAGKNKDGSGSTITGYTLYWKEGAAPSSTDYDGTATVADVQDRRYTIENLNSGTYHVAVTSRNSAGMESPLSVVAEAVATVILSFSIGEVSLGDTTLTITADEDIRLAVADDTALLAGITVNRIPFGGSRETDNLATAATLSGNSLVITISPPIAQGEEWFVKIAAGLVQDNDGNLNTVVELKSKQVAVGDRFLVANLPRSTATVGGTTFVPDKYRTHFVTFGIVMGVEEEGEYRLGLKEASKTVPTVSELIDATAALTRTLSTNRINIYLPFHIGGTYFDTGATQDYSNARATLLSPETSYTLYITPADGNGAVEKLLDFTTDAVASSVPNDSYGRPLFYGLPSASYTYTTRDNEAFMLVAEFENNPTDPIYIRIADQIVSSTATGMQCDPTCTVNPNLPSYQGLVSSPAKIYIIAGTRANSHNEFEFDNGSTVMYVYLTSQTAP